jgi:hypothetical protein
MYWNLRYNSSKLFHLTRRRQLLTTTTTTQTNQPIIITTTSPTTIPPTALRHSKTISQLDSIWKQTITPLLFSPTYSNNNSNTTTTLIPPSLHLSRIKALARITLATPFGGVHEIQNVKRTLGALNRLIFTTNVALTNPPLLVDAYNVTMRATLRSDPQLVIKMFDTLKDNNHRVFPNEISYVLALFAYSLEEDNISFQKLLREMRNLRKHETLLRTCLEELELLSTLPSAQNFEAKAKFIGLELERVGYNNNSNKSTTSFSPALSSSNSMNNIPSDSKDHPLPNIRRRLRGLVPPNLLTTNNIPSTQMTGIQLMEELYECIVDGQRITDGHFVKVAKALLDSVRLVRPHHVKSLESVYYSTMQRQQGDPSPEFASALLKVYCSVPGQDENAMNGIRHAIRFIQQLQDSIVQTLPDDVIKTLLLKTCTSASSLAMKTAMDIMSRGFPPSREVRQSVALAVVQCCSTECDRVIHQKKPTTDDVINPISSLQSIIETNLVWGMKKLLVLGDGVTDKSHGEILGFLTLLNHIEENRYQKQQPQQQQQQQQQQPQLVATTSLEEELRTFLSRFIPENVEVILQSLTLFYYTNRDREVLEKIVLHDLKKINPLPVFSLMDVYHRLIRLRGDVGDADMASSLVGDMQILALPINADTIEDLVYSFVKARRHNEAVGHLIALGRHVTPHFKTLQFLLTTCEENLDWEEKSRVEELMKRWVEKGSISSRNSSTSNNNTSFVMSNKNQRIDDDDDD